MSRRNRVVAVVASVLILGPAAPLAWAAWVLASRADEIGVE